MEIIWENEINDDYDKKRAKIINIRKTVCVRDLLYFLTVSFGII